MKVTLFNDTRKDWRLHIGSIRGVHGENRVPSLSMVVFEVPDGQDVFVKVWEPGVVLVQPTQYPAAQTELPLSDAERTDIEARANQSGVLHELQGYCRDPLCQRCAGLYRHGTGVRR